jgi:acetyl esterase/lipase
LARETHIGDVSHTFSYSISASVLILAYNKSAFRLQKGRLAMRKCMTLFVLSALLCSVLPLKAQENFTEQEVSFTVGEDTLYATLTLPAGAPKFPAALLLSGSGPTDRDGNTPLIFGIIDSHRHLAHILAARGVASLRYDKIGSGKTGLASRMSKPESIDFLMYVAHARAAYDFLKARPEIDAEKLMLLGHSEGGLIAQIVAEQVRDDGSLAALVLAMPLAKTYLATVRDQIAAQYAILQSLSLVTAEQVAAELAELDRIIAEILETGALSTPIQMEYFRDLFSNPLNNKFMAQASRFDPAVLAAKTPKDLPVLVFCAEFDVQIACADMERLMAGFKAAENPAQLVVLAKVNHVFKEVEKPSLNPIVDYANEALPFSAQAREALQAFVAEIFSE